MYFIIIMVMTVIIGHMLLACIFILLNITVYMTTWLNGTMQSVVSLYEDWR